MSGVTRKVNTIIYFSYAIKYILLQTRLNISLDIISSTKRCDMALNGNLSYNLLSAAANTFYPKTCLKLQRKTIVHVTLLKLAVLL